MEFYKNIKKAKLKRGFSIVGSLLGFFLLGLSTVGLSSYMARFDEAKSVYSRQYDVYYKHQSILESARKIITESKIKVTSSTDSEKSSLGNQGVCQLVENFVSYDDIKDKIYGKVEMKESDIMDSTKSGIESDRWKYFIQSSGNWKEASGKCNKESDSSINGFYGIFTEDDYNKCFEWISSDVNVQEKAYARLSITPLKIPSFEKINSSGTDNIFFNHIVFELKSTISSFMGQQPDGGGSTWSVSKEQILVFGSEINECSVCNDVATPTACKIVNVSGFGLSSNLAQNNIYYHAPYDSPDKSLSAYVYRSVLQRGNFADRDLAVVQSNTSQNVGMSCTANLFRCSNLSNVNRFHPEYFDPMISVGFNLELNGVVASNIDSIETIIKKAGVESNPIMRHTTLFTSTDQTTRIGQSGDDTGGGAEVVEYDKPDGDTLTLWNLNSGGNELTLRIANENKEGDQSICEKACVEPSSYYPALKVKWNSQYSSDNPRTSYSEEIELKDGSSDARIACTTCHSKSCHRFGLGTFGTKASQPAEPIDANIPECTGGGSPLSYVLKDETSAGEVGKNCMVLENGKLIPKTCSENIDNTICFINGTAKIIPKTVTIGSDSITLGKNEDACYRASIERLRIGDAATKGLLANMAIAYLVPPVDTSGDGKGIKEILEGQGLVSEGPEGDKYYEIYNSASQGMFLPIATTSPDTAWINIERDYSGMLVSGLPFISSVATGISATAEDKDRIKWAFFFRQPFQTAGYSDAFTNSAIETEIGWSRPSRPIFVNFSNVDPDFGQSPIVTTSDNSKKRLLLTHHIHYKGLRIVSDNQTNSYPFICVASDGTVTITSDKSSNFEDGYSKCGVDKFYPPTTAKEWTEALMKVAPTAPRYPFPNPFNFEDGIPFTNNVHDHTKTDLKFAYSDLMKTSDYTDSKALDGDDINSFIFHSGRVLTSDGSKKVLGSARSAWIGLEPRAQRQTDGSVTYVNVNKRISSWMVNLEKVASLPSRSLFRVIKDAVAGMAEVTDSTEGSNTIGIMDHNGAPGLYWWLQAPNMGIKPSRFVRPCRVKKDELSYKSHLMPIFIGEASAWPTSCDEQDYTEGSHTVDKDNIAELTGADIEKIKTSVRGARYLGKYRVEAKLAIFDENQFCKQWKREKERRATGRCVIKAYNNSTIDVGGVDYYGYAETKTCRETQRDEVCKSVNLSTELDNYKTQMEQAKDNAQPMYNQAVTVRAQLVTDCHRTCGIPVVSQAQRLQECRTQKTQLKSNCNTLSGSYKGDCKQDQRGDVFKICKDPSTSDVNGATCIDKCNNLSSVRNTAQEQHQCAQSLSVSEVDCKDAIKAGDLSRGDIEYEYKVSGTEGNTTCEVTLARMTYNDLPAKQCWALDKLNPRAETEEMDGHKGPVGVAKVDLLTGEQYWTNDAECWKPEDGLKQLDSVCKVDDKEYYSDFADIPDDNLCDDDDFDDTVCTVEIN